VRTLGTLIAPTVGHLAIAAAAFKAHTSWSSCCSHHFLAGWSIWVGIAVSTRGIDVRAAQQLGIAAGPPPLVIVALMALNVIPTTLALALAAALLLIDGLAWRVVAAMFDRERHVAGRR
jgi:hypothetical protein